MASLANDLLDIREYNKALKEEGESTTARVAKLNRVFEDWYFTAYSVSDRIIARKDGSPNEIEV